MPLFQVRCSKCKKVERILVDSLDMIPVDVKHCVPLFGPNVVACDGTMERNATGPSTSQIEVLDNGAMSRKLERYADAERLHKERAANGDPLAGGVNRVDPRERG